MQQVNLLGAVHQAVDQIRVPRLPLTGAGQMKMPQIERGCRAWRFGALCPRSYPDNNPVKIQGTGLGETHDLESPVRPPNFPALFRSNRRTMARTSLAVIGAWASWSRAARPARFGSGAIRQIHGTARSWSFAGSSERVWGKDSKHIRGLCPRRHGGEEGRGLGGFAPSHPVLRPTLARCSSRRI